MISADVYTQNAVYPELTQALADMRGQNPLYRPTAFWDAASQEITAELCEHGLERFRSLPKPLGFFAPTYGPPGSSLGQDQVEDLEKRFRKDHPDAVKQQLRMRFLFGGEAEALADYRVLIAADDPAHLPGLERFSESDFGAPVEHFEFEGRRFSRSALNYLLGLAFMKKHLGGEVPRTVLEIGGGYGTLGEVLASSGIEGLRYVDLDIPPTGFVAQAYLTAVLGESRVSTYAQTRDLEEIAIDSLCQTSVLCAWQIEKLRGHVDLFVNFISFQEMEPHIVRNYLSHVARLGTRWVLLRNMREGKQKRQAGHHVGVDTPILGDDYLAMLPGYELVARNVLPFGYRTVDGFHSELMLLRKS